MPSQGTSPRFPQGLKILGDPVENLALMLGVIRLAANFPQVSLHGFLATGLILLRREVLLVRGDLVQIALTSLQAAASLQNLAG